LDAGSVMLIHKLQTMVQGRYRGQNWELSVRQVWPTEFVRTSWFRIFSAWRYVAKMLVRFAWPTAIDDLEVKTV